MVANGRSLLHYEKSTAGGSGSSGESNAAVLDRHGGKEVVDYGEDGLATYADGTREDRESFEAHAAAAAGAGQDSSLEKIRGDSFGGHTDSQVLGPRSVGLDFAFPFAGHVYGIPEHTSPLSLPTTTTGSANIAPHYSEPYRLYNLDVFEYELDQTMALYGHIPFMVAHDVVDGKGVAAGVFWFNPSETFIDVSDALGENVPGSSRKTFKESHWISESGEVDFFLFSGPSSKEVFSQFTLLTGRQQLPPMFALGYHQCRWNYRDEKDVAKVESTFEQLDYPVDVIWLDIEHTDGKRYFTWDKSVFPSPLEMQKNVSAHGRRMVTIVDPHIKRDSNFHVHSEATSLQLYIKDKNGGDFDGWCWPGSSSYLDFTNPRVRAWWAERFSLSKYVGSTMDLFTWNDMNEPSVFNGPEVSMPKDTKNLDGVEHREWHNLYGLYMQSATADGLVLRSPTTDPAAKQRPFVLSRAFWAGSQRFGAIWTGDNRADWGHLRVAAPMLLSINLAGLSFAGADVGGFFGDADAELFTRWYQAGSFTPFFRGHAHHDSKRREPWVYGDPYTSILRSAAMTRYALLPFWYTVFFEAYDKGLPVMRTMFTEFPDDESVLTMDDQWMVGQSLLVKPATTPGQRSVDVYLPGSEGWFDLASLKKYPANSRGQRTTVDAPMDKIPVFIRAGEIIPEKLRLRRSSKLMFFDPYTLVITPTSAGTAKGNLYMDDEITLAHDHGAYVHRVFEFSSGKLTCRAAPQDPVARSATKYDPANTVERVVIADQFSAPRKVKVVAGHGAEMSLYELNWTYDAANRVVTLKKPDVKLNEDWEITLEY